MTREESVDVVGVVENYQPVVALVALQPSIHQAEDVSGRLLNAGLQARNFLLEDPKEG
jgi:hypothetical protein